MPIRKPKPADPNPVIATPSKATKVAPAAEPVDDAAEHAAAIDAPTPTVP